MKRIFYLSILLIICTFTGIAQSVTSVLVPQYIADNLLGSGEASRTPYVFRAKLTGLTANATYRYKVQAVILATDGPTTAGAGNQIFLHQSGSFGYSSASSFTTAGGYDSLVTNASGECEGWFGIEPTTNARFTAGNYIHARIVTNSGVTGNTTSTNYLTVADSSKAISYNNTSTNGGTGIWSKSMAADKNLAVLWDNVFATGRPLSIAIIENDGIAFRSASSPNNYPLFYRNNVDSFSGAWGTIIPNNNSNGVKRIENRKLTDGTLYYANFDADGIWPTGNISTISPAGGFTAIKLDSSDVPLIPMPTFYFDQTSYTVSEAAGTASISVKYKNPTFINTSVDVSVKAGGSAIQGTDFTFSSTTTLTFAPTDTIKTFTIPIVNDILVEGNETFSLRLSNPTNSGLLMADSVSTITITDDDFTSPIFYFDKTVYSIGEGGGSVTVNVKYKNQAASATSVDVAVKTGGTAVLGTDYSYSTTTLNFSTTDTMKSISIPITNDALIEGNETFILRLTNPSSGTSITVDSLSTVTIIDDDLSLPTVSVVTKQSVSEVAGTATVSVKLSAKATIAGSVSLTANNATATSGDYTFTASTVNFAIGDSIKTATVTINDDVLIEGNEYFIMQISSPTNLTLGNAVDTITITDNDYPRLPIGVISTVNAVTGASDSLGKKYDEVGVVYGINYRPAGLQFVIRDNTGGITVFKTTGSYGYTVKEGDSVRVPGTVAQFNGLTEFNADTVIVLGTNKAIKTPVVITKLVEANENDLVRINGVQFLTPMATWPTVASNISVRNATDTIVIRLQLANADILGTTAPAGTFDIIGLGSQFDATNPFTTGYQLFPRFQSDIIENIPLIFMDTASVSVNESAATVSVKLKISKVNGLASTINISSAGTATTSSDYIPPSGTVTFPATAVNGDSIMVTYAINDDAVVESNETIIVSISPNTNAIVVGGTKTITILDNDVPPATLTIDTATLAINEGAGIVKVRVRISNVNGKATAASLAFTGTASVGSDYTVSSASVNFPASAANGDSVIISYNIIDDNLFEATPETIITTITAGNNAVITGGTVETIVITDNDPNGINRNNNNNGVSIYPNPSEGAFTVKSGVKMLSVKLYDLLGNEIAAAEPMATSVSFENLAKGLYLVVAQTSNGIASQKLIIK